MAEHVRARVVITGRVQGVAFRYEARRAAERIGVGGWVRNCRDGSVEALFEGTPAQVDDMLTWCRRGPALARVDDVAAHWEQPTGEFPRFEITF
jgi:acylphosphatase